MYDRYGTLYTDTDRYDSCCITHYSFLQSNFRLQIQVTRLSLPLSNNYGRESVLYICLPCERGTHFSMFFGNNSSVTRRTQVLMTVTYHHTLPSDTFKFWRDNWDWAHVHDKGVAVVDFHYLDVFARRIPTARVDSRQNPPPWR